MGFNSGLKGLNQDSNDNGVVVVNFISENPVKSTVLLHRSIHKYTPIGLF